jgi:glycosyltransferase involved in cell wall biosynthesis
LYICGHAPCPATYGAQLRILNIGRLLQKQGFVRLVVVPRYKPTQEEFRATRAVFGNFDYFVAENPAGRGMVSKIRRRVDLRWVQGRGETVSAQAQEQLEKLYADHDIVWIHTLAVADRLGRYSWHPNSVLDIDDLCSHKYKQQIMLKRGFFNKARAIWRMSMKARWEKDILNRFTVACVCSNNDHAAFNNNRYVIVLPNGFDAPSAPPVRNPEGFARIGFIGTLEYPPNSDGLNWFIKHILSRINSKNPAVRLRVIGKMSESAKLIQHHNVDYLGFMDNVSDEISTWSLSIVPLRVGGGTRIKILESFSRKCPVVSTSVGAWGLDVVNGKHLIIADSAENMAEACVKILIYPEIGQHLANCAWRLFMREYTWDTIAPRIEDAVNQCLSR